MSDLFYPRSASGDIYGDHIIDFISQLTYTVRHNPGDEMAVVYETVPSARARPVMKTKIPSPYYEHVVRFLWRYYLWFQLFTVLHTRPNTSSLLPVGVGLLKRMLIMMDTIIEQLFLGCIALGNDLKVDSRFPFFDFYLTTEFVVGFHDHDTVESWRRKPENRDLDLERIDPFQLDWAAYDAALGPTLNGTRFDHTLDGALKKKGECLVVMDAAAIWYGRQLRKGKGNGDHRVNGTAGMGIRMAAAQDDQLDAEGEVDDDAADVDEPAAEDGNDEERPTTETEASVQTPAQSSSSEEEEEEEEEGKGDGNGAGDETVFSLRAAMEEEMEGGFATGDEGAGDGGEGNNTDESVAPVADGVSTADIAGTSEDVSTDASVMAMDLDTSTSELARTTQTPPPNQLALKKTVPTAGVDPLDYLKFAKKAVEDEQLLVYLREYNSSSDEEEPQPPARSQFTTEDHPETPPYSDFDVPDMPDYFDGDYFDGDYFDGSSERHDQPSVTPSTPRSHQSDTLDISTNTLEASTGMPERLGSDVCDPPNVTQQAGMQDKNVPTRRRGRPRGSHSLKVPQIYERMHLRSRSTAETTVDHSQASTSKGQPRNKEGEGKRAGRDDTPELTVQVRGKERVGCRETRRKGKKVPKGTKEVSPRLSVDVEQNADSGTRHAFANITLTISPHKTSVVADECESEDEDSTSGDDEETNDSSGVTDTADSVPQSDEVGIDTIRSCVKQMAAVCQTDGSVLHQEVVDGLTSFQKLNQSNHDKFVRWKTALSHDRLPVKKTFTKNVFIIGHYFARLLDMKVEVGREIQDGFVLLAQR